MAREKVDPIVSPRGEAKYAWLKNPDVAFNDGGVFKVNLLIPEGECKELCAAIDKAVDSSFETAKGQAKPAVAKKLVKEYPYGPQIDDDGEEIPGMLEFKFKMNHTITSKKDGKTFTIKPDIFDSKGKALSPCPAIYAGSILKVSFVLFEYFMAARAAAGVTLRMNGVQVIDLVTGGGASASRHGFGEEDGGYDSSEDDAPAEGGTDTEDF
jgi:hypothetical protein